MSSQKPCTSFATEIEEIPLETSVEQDDESDSPRTALQRSSTDAHLSEYRPQLKVRFHTLASGMEKRLSSEGINLLSSKAHLIGYANWAGGWQNTVLRRRRSGHSPKSEEEEVQEITEAMKEDKRLMADDVDGEVLRRDALRELTKSLKVKKEIKERLTISRTTIRRSGRNISFYKSLKYSISMKLFQFKERIKVAMHDFALWHKDLKAIEGMFGSSVGSYFRFLRYLFLLNMLVAFITFGFLFIPQTAFGDNESEMLAEVNNFTSSDFEAASETSAPYSNSANRSSFGPLDWLTGAGWFDSTQLYYGGYSTGIIGSQGSLLSYDMSQAYFLTITVCFILYFIMILNKIYTMYRQNYIDTDEGLCVTFVEKIFSAWDFNITDEDSSKIKRRSIYNELIELLQEFQDEEEIEGFFKCLMKIIMRGLVWFVLVMFLLLLGWGLYLLLKDQLHDLTVDESGYWRKSLELLVYPLITTLLMVIIPLVFEAVGRMEKYTKPRIELYANLIRVFLLEVLILVALMVFWYENSPGLEKELKHLKQTLIPYAVEYSEGNSPSANHTSVECWENSLGEEIYRLVLVDFLVILVSTLIVDPLRPLLVQRGIARESLLEFFIPRNTLHIIYNQTLLWAGLFFCPLLPLIISMKFSLIFYLQKWSVMRNLQPIERPWRASQTETLFYALTLLSLILATSSYGFIIVRGYSSPRCGPFQGFTHYIDIITTGSVEQEKILLKVIGFFLRPGSILVLIVVLVLCVYCIMNVSEGRAQLVGVLRSQLKLEMKDRVFLQRLIEKVNRGEYPPSRQSPCRSNPSSPVLQPPYEDDVEPKHLTKKSSFIYSRNSSTTDYGDISSRL